MKKTLLIALCVLMAGCLTLPAEEQEIDVTVIDEDFFDLSDEWMSVPFEELPFSVEIPSWWSFTENSAEYILWFDEGVSGSIVFDKSPKDGGLSELVPDGSEVIPGATEDLTSFCDGDSCVVQINELHELYGFVVSDKGFSDSEKAEVKEIIGRLGSD